MVEDDTKPFNELTCRIYSPSGFFAGSWDVFGSMINQITFDSKLSRKKGGTFFISLRLALGLELEFLTQFKVKHDSETEYSK